MFVLWDPVDSFMIGFLKFLYYGLGKLNRLFLLESVC